MSNIYEDYVKQGLLKPPVSAASTFQVGGDHYHNKGTYQPWNVMESWMTPEEFKGFLKGNVIKYIARSEEKGGMQDLEKAQHYLAKLLEMLAKSAPNQSA
jgi:hypothetical protein